MSTKDPNRALSPRYDGMPLRYEDSRPAMTQAYTHQSIVYIGDTIHKGLIDELEYDKRRSIEAAKNEVWQEAEKIKEDAVEKCRQHAKVDREKAVKNLKKVHEKALKEEALRVEGDMQKLTIEQVKAEREMGEKKLVESMTKTQNAGELTKTKAVDEARQEERRIAKEAIDVLTRQVAQREESTAKRTADDKQRALTELREKLEREKELVLAETIKRERISAAGQIASINSAHVHEVRYIEYQIRTHYENHQQALEKITHIEDDKIKLQEEYAILKKEFQSFINKSSGFEEGQADFLLA